MNEKFLYKAGIDYNNGVKRFFGNASLYEKYLRKFEEDQNFELAQKAMKSRDYEGMLKYIHTLKGVTGNLSMTELFNSCSELVAAIRNKEFHSVETIFHRISHLHGNVCRAINDIKQN